MCQSCYAHLEDYFYENQTSFSYRNLNIKTLCKVGKKEYLFLRPLIMSMKQRARPNLSFAIGKLMAQMWSSKSYQVDHVLSAPYEQIDHAFELSSGVAATLNKPLMSPFVKRDHLKSKSLNLKNRGKREFGTQVKSLFYGSCVFVDDLCTSGSTAKNCLNLITYSYCEVWVISYKNRV